MSLPDHTDIAQRWLRWADEDLALAEHIIAGADVVARGACVFAHQAAEKALKALLILRNIDLPKLHDPDRLAMRLPDDEGSAFAAIELPELTRWSMEGRYPADIDEATHADALRAIGVARRVLDVARSLTGYPMHEGQGLVPLGLLAVLQYRLEHAD